MTYRLRIMMVLLICLLLAGAAPVARAQESGDDAAATAMPGTEEHTPKFALVPVGDYPQGYFDDLPLSPGESMDLAVNVVNLDQAPVSLVVFKSNAMNAINGGFTAAAEDEEATGATTWIDFPETTVDLGPGGQQEIPFRVTVPADAKPGQYIAALSVQTPGAVSLGGSTSLDFTIAYSISVGILVPGETTAAFTLGEPEISVDNLLTTISVPITNTGNYLVQPAGDLVLKDAQGKEVLSAPVTMGSVYAGNSTTLEVPVPDQIAPGDYTLDLTLTDPESSATQSIESATVTVPAAENAKGVSVTSATIEPNADQIAFANVAVTLENGGSQVAASDVVLQVLRNGTPVEDFPLATNQVLLSGENTYSARYIPADEWASGTYTFRLEVSAVDPSGGQRTSLLDQDLDANIVVP